MKSLKSLVALHSRRGWGQKFFSKSLAKKGAQLYKNLSQMTTIFTRV